MTRINVVPVTELHNKHLLAEYRELPRVFGAARKWYEQGKRHDELPTTYRLGKGHVLFFYTRLGYCWKRQHELFRECINRNFQVRLEPTRELIAWAPPWMMHDYTPTRNALRINRERIEERLEAMSHAAHRTRSARVVDVQ